MDCLLEFSQRSTENSQDFYPPINLKPELDHVLGLYSLSTYNSLTNIMQGLNDIIIFQKTKNLRMKMVPSLLCSWLSQAEVMKLLHSQ